MPRKFIAHQFSITPGTNAHRYEDAVRAWSGKKKLVLTGRIKRHTIFAIDFFFVSAARALYRRRVAMMSERMLKNMMVVVWWLLNARASHNLQAVPFGLCFFLCSIIAFMQMMRFSDSKLFWCFCRCRCCRFRNVVWLRVEMEAWHSMRFHLFSRVFCVWNLLDAALSIYLIKNDSMFLIIYLCVSSSHFVHWQPHRESCRLRSVCCTGRMNTCQTTVATRAYISLTVAMAAWMSINALFRWND